MIVPFSLHLGDCLDVLRTLAEASVDAIVTDPPYHLTDSSRGSHARSSNPAMPHGRHRIGDKGFMGKVWDGGDIAHRVELWLECLRVLKPGGHLLAFAGTRTYHRMACAIEDAGFDLRDQLGWLYGSGFPKSRNLDGQWQGWGTALKPAWEPICMARKPLAGTVAANVQAHGTGALNIDACRVGTDDALRAGAGGTWDAMHKHEGRGRAGEASAERRYTSQGGTDFAMKPGPRGGDAAGRWPANVIHDGSPEVLAAFAQFGENKGQTAALATRNSDKTRNTFGTFAGQTDAEFQPHDSLGSAARFFYCAKASRTDRNEGCEHLERQPLHWSNGVQNPGSFQSEGTDKTSQNNHPTVKPTELMGYLCRLVTPPGGVVLDPFMGSGSTGKAAMREGFRFIGIDMTAEYLGIARARIEHELTIRRVESVEVSVQPDLFGAAA
ncbi:DNA-methyltransferase [Cupriavidus basilensis]|uniref:Methyltransferase n=1 Tax=Cupriavidus basilensis TaxID=68895 RepID=A0A0C4Y6X9_9BURK|nr:site-specific DNA-methyltransferase [Cupriavidus basilensis]AJG18790.1 Adenine-specific methyltransferase [Cupriavidus basilensis]